MQKKKISEILSGGGEGISMGGIRRTGRKFLKWHYYKRSTII